MHCTRETRCVKLHTVYVASNHTAKEMQVASYRSFEHWVIILGVVIHSEA